MNDQNSEDHELTQGAAPGMPRYGSLRRERRDGDRDPVYAFLGSPWFNGALLLFLTYVLVAYLRSAQPLLAVVYPGMFLLPAILNLIAHFARWDTKQKLYLSGIPLAAYDVLATTVMFVAAANTGDDVYKRYGLASLIFTVPFTLLVVLALVLPNRRPDDSGMPPA
jgi:hypothetical protein